MEYINNGDSASSIRTKLNLLIDYYNTNSVAGTSGTSGTEGTSGTQAPGGGGATPITLWGSMMASLMGEDTIQAACDAASTGFSHQAYLVKGVGNISYLPQTGDTIYADAGLTYTIPSMKYYGYKDGPMMSYHIYMGPGGVSSVNQCV
jgi:hypothetical protein